jgi:hypothetical protein
MVRQPDPTMQPAPDDNQLMSKHRVLSFKAEFRLEWRGQDGQKKPNQRDHRTNLADSSLNKPGYGFRYTQGSHRRFDPFFDRGEVERRAKRTGGPRQHLRVFIKIAVASAWRRRLDFC